uniref:Ubiquitin-like protease family profile domain-containing protein n=1 Tax=Triticum urartu TaxID=4572 RepID=A0A8R7QLQ8_TRIUA
MWTTNHLYFPVTIRKHWFSFIVSLKERPFAFLDLAFDE